MISAFVLASQAVKHPVQEEIVRERPLMTSGFRVGRGAFLNLGMNCSWELLVIEEESNLNLCQQINKPPYDLYLNFEKSSWKNHTRRTGFLACKNQCRN